MVETVHIMEQDKRVSHRSKAEPESRSVHKMDPKFRRKG